MSITKTVSQPSRSYQVSLSIKDTEYEVRSVKIISTLASAWQVVTIDLFVDPKDIIKKQISPEMVVKQAYGHPHGDLDNRNKYDIKDGKKVKKKKKTSKFDYTEF